VNDGPNAGAPDRQPVGTRGPNAGGQEPKAGGPQRPVRERPGADAENGPAAGKTLSPNQKGEMMRALAAEMNTHRANTAKLMRLTALARESRDAELIARVNVLTGKEDLRHQNSLERIRTAYGPENLRIGMRRMDNAGNAGRGRGNAGDKKAPERDKPNDAGTGSEPAAGKGGGNGAGGQKRGGGR
jgi:hypothetical protein